MITISDLRVAFGGVVAINDLNVVIGDPITGIIGPNGAGKTTLVNVMSGFVKPIKGSITAHEIDLLAHRNYKLARWGLRRTFQTEQVVEELSVRDNVKIMLDSLPMSAKERNHAVEEVLEYACLSNSSRRLGGDLDTYERRLVEICKALVGAPRVILMDEPGGGLGDNEMRSIKRIILEIKEFCGAMTLLIDHDIDLISSTCASTLVLDFGEKIAFGPTKEVLSNPRVKAAYLGTTEA
ncbi:MAG: ABC transporter ATP-binding protein [Oceanospirillales bacterium]|nr:ABC transporter ATP-binding protein [Oceanospirillales bacterium]